jgi:hypothetical protein
VSVRDTDRECPAGDPVNVECQRLQVQLSFLDAQQVARWASDEPLVVSERLAQARDLDVEPARIGCAPVPEELGDESLTGDDAIRMQQEQRKQRPLSRPSYGDHVAVHSHLERAQDPKLDTTRSHRQRSVHPCGDRHNRLLKPHGDSTETRSPHAAPPMLYAAKCYWPEVTEREVEQAATRAASDRDSGYVGVLLFPDDELVLCLFDGASPAAVREAADRAGIPCERVMGLRWLGTQPLERRTTC